MPDAGHRGKLFHVDGRVLDGDFGRDRLAGHLVVQHEPPLDRDANARRIANSPR